MIFLLSAALGNAILNGKLLHVYIMYVLIHVKRLKLEQVISGGLYTHTSHSVFKVKFLILKILQFVLALAV